ncbi:Cardioacceleratory peptide receptor [Eumeta japonica]|uniref:Cardioacceleratory peptide receptor n=1 Tax=Eumeta variegata TaxID=151549 RepID=A0A4C2AF91_EUMVA|nr:Cardioacceleratory peptide receptor [Eumeta japonica]
MDEIMMVQRLEIEKAVEANIFIEILKGNGGIVASLLYQILINYKKAVGICSFTVAIQSIHNGCFHKLKEYEYELQKLSVKCLLYSTTNPCHRRVNAEDGNKINKPVRKGMQEYVSKTKRCEINALLAPNARSTRIRWRRKRSHSSDFDVYGFPFSVTVNPHTGRRHRRCAKCKYSKIKYGDRRRCVLNCSQTAQLALLWVLLLAIVAGNATVILALLLTSSKKPNELFIMQLAIADLGVGLLMVLPDLVQRMTICWLAGQMACKIMKFYRVGYLFGRLKKVIKCIKRAAPGSRFDTCYRVLRRKNVVVTYSSTYVLVALSIDRCDAITHPMNFTGSCGMTYQLTVAALGVGDVGDRRLEGLPPRKKNFAYKLLKRGLAKVLPTKHFRRREQHAGDWKTDGHHRPWTLTIPEQSWYVAGLLSRNSKFEILNSITIERRRPSSGGYDTHEPFPDLTLLYLGKRSLLILGGKCYVFLLACTLMENSPSVSDIGSKVTTFFPGQHLNGKCYILSSYRGAKCYNHLVIGEQSATFSLDIGEKVVHTLQISGVKCYILSDIGDQSATFSLIIEGARVLHSLQISGSKCYILSVIGEQVLHSLQVSRSKGYILSSYRGSKVLHSLQVPRSKVLHSLSSYRGQSATFSPGTEEQSATFSLVIGEQSATFSGIEEQSATFSLVIGEQSATFSLGTGEQSATFSPGIEEQSATFSGYRGAKCYILSRYRGAKCYILSRYRGAKCYILSGIEEQSATFSLVIGEQSAFSPGIEEQSATFSLVIGEQSATFSPGTEEQSATFSGYRGSKELTFCPGIEEQSATFSLVIGEQSATFCPGIEEQSATFSLVIRSKMLHSLVRVSRSKVLHSL